MDATQNPSCSTGISADRKPLHRHWLGACSLAFCALAAGSYSSTALAQTVVPTTVLTGHDDLRGGNRAFISMRLMNGTVFSEQLLSTGFPSGTVTAPPVTVTFPGTAAPAQIRSITIRHDGNPRNGHPFDTYDTWDLQRLLVRHRNGDATLYNSENDSRAGDFVHQFTGESRTITKFITPAPGEADFVITGMFASPSGVTVTVRNRGASGRVTRAACHVRERRVRRAASVVIPSGATDNLTVRLTEPVGTTTCSVDGTNLGGRAELVTANNAAQRVFRSHR